MRVGIDFRTTHTVAAVVDRGNYPVVSFDGMDAWPSVIAANGAGEYVGHWGSTIGRSNAMAYIQRQRVPWGRYFYRQKLRGKYLSR